MNSYFDILRKLSTHGIPYLLTGTAALKVARPDLLQHYELSDCDLLMPFNMGVIQKTVRLLIDEQWRVSLWERSINASLPSSELRGKYYLRARQNALILDLTYEYPPFSWTELCEQRASAAGFALCDPNIILAFKAARGKPKDLALLSLFHLSS